MRRMVISLAALALVMMVFGGCQDKKLKDCKTELENLQALFEGTQDSLNQCQQEKEQYAQQLTDAQRTLATAQKKQPQAKADFAGEDARWDPQKGTITVTLERGVLFDSGKVTLKSSSRDRLARIARTIAQKYADKEIYVIGHTDTDPIRKSKWADNWQLSTERSLAVVRYLIQHGVSARHAVAAGRGEYQPVSSSKAKNRRVEIVVHTFND